MQTTSGPKFVLLVIGNILISLALAVAVLFLTAGSFRFWQGWLYMAVVFISSLSTSVYFYVYDRPLFERRLQRREKSRQQKLLRRIFLPVYVIAMVLPGLDYRLGWSQKYLGGVPLWLVLLSQLLVLSGFVVVFLAMKANSFASRTIQVESGQTTITTPTPSCATPFIPAWPCSFCSPRRRSAPISPGQCLSSICFFSYSAFWTRKNFCARSCRATPSIACVRRSALCLMCGELQNRRRQLLIARRRMPHTSRFAWMRIFVPAVKASRLVPHVSQGSRPGP